MLMVLLFQQLKVTLTWLEAAATMLAAYQIWLLPAFVVGPMAET
jgi:hypothetical protein